jgi:hypothetical protein
VCIDFYEKCGGGARLLLKGELCKEEESKSVCVRMFKEYRSSCLFTDFGDALACANFCILMAQHEINSSSKVACI